jgi:hypothetical protein
LWLGGVPYGKHACSYYNDVFKKKIIDTIEDKANDKERFLLLRKIDYALFSFDKLIISKSLNKKISINHKIMELCDSTLTSFNDKNYTFNYII